MTKRIYSVEFQKKIHLVNASSQASAINHVLAVHHKIDVKVAKVHDVVKLISTGIVVEEAGDTDVNQENLPLEK